MRQTWRWFGPKDQVSLSDIRQAGAAGIVTALHEFPNGVVWSAAAIRARQELIRGQEQSAPTGLTWDVVESLPVTEDIKRQSGDWRTHIDNYKTSIENLAASGIEVICYNFMPVLDWTRTDLRHTLPAGARCMRFDVIDFAVFDIHILARKGAAEDFPAEIKAQAQQRHASMSQMDQRRLVDNVISGLPGAEESYSLSDLHEQLDLYAGISPERLRQNLLDFLAEIVPVAERCNVRLCCHPDDPPFSLLGLPRIMSTEADYRAMTEAVDSPANGITLCSGSLGVRASTDLPGMVKRLGPKIHFVHLRNVHRETEAVPNSFYEAAHLEGSTDMVALVFALLDEEARRQSEGRADHDIPFRPDHGQEILSDLTRNGQPGYPAVGRLKGLAELRGIIRAREYMSA